MAILGTRVVSNFHDTEKYPNGERNNHIQHKIIKLHLESSISRTRLVKGNIKVLVLMGDNYSQKKKKIYLKVRLLCMPIYALIGSLTLKNLKIFEGLGL